MFIIIRDQIINLDRIDNIKKEDFGAKKDGTYSHYGIEFSEQKSFSFGFGSKGFRDKAWNDIVDLISKSEFSKALQGVL